MSNVLPLTGTHPEAETDPDYRAHDLAAERCEGSSFALTLWLAEHACGEEGKWSTWQNLERRLLRGEELPNRSLLILLFNAPAETAIRARQQLVDRMRDHRDWLAMVQREFLPAAVRAVAADDAECFEEPEAA